MRKQAWIPLILLGVGSLLVIQGQLFAPPAQELPTGALPSDLTNESRTSTNQSAEAELLAANRSPDRDPDVSQPQLRLDAHSSLAEENLDLASAEEVRRRLEKAILDAQKTRSLFISPGIVDAVASKKRVRVIFETGTRWSEEAASELLAGASGRAAFDSLRMFPLLDRGAAEVGAQALLHLIENEGTGHIELDSVHRASLLETIPIIRADLAHQQGHDGDGFVVAILDTGVDPTHPMYADRIVEEACFSLGKDCPNGRSEMFGPGAAVPCSLTGCRHGTRVAGIALGDEPGGGLIGVAPHAELIAIQIFSDVDGDPGAYSSDILAGLQHVLSLAAFHEIASANLSLGGDLFTSEAECDQTVSSQFRAAALLRAAGVLTVAASGNKTLTNAITTPACLSNVIGVGSTSDSDEISNFSNSASFLRLLAPGEFVRSSTVGGGTASGSGTSMASAHVAGGIAAIREAVPSATADEIDNALALSGIPVFDSRNGITTPRIEINEAIGLLEMNIPPPGDPGGGEGTPAATSSSSGGGGGGCGLVGIECLLVLGLVRLGRRSRR